MIREMTMPRQYARKKEKLPLFMNDGTEILEDNVDVNSSILDSQANRIVHDLLRKRAKLPGSLGADSAMLCGVSIPRIYVE